MLKRFQVLVNVVLHKPVHVAGLDGEADEEGSAYYRRFGVTASDKRSAELLVQGDIVDGEMIWSEVETKKLSERDVRALNRRAPPIDPDASRGETSGIWYRSGHFFY